MQSATRLLTTLAMSLAVGGAYAQDTDVALGNWHGTLDTPQGAFTLVVTIEQSDDGMLTGSLESVDQAPGQKIPLSDVVTQADALQFSVPAIGATYRGDWSPTEEVWVGTFTQGIEFKLVLRKGTPERAAEVAGMDGAWHGILRRNQVDLRLVLHVSTGERGTTATFDSPDLGAFGLQVAGFTRNRDAVSFSVPAGQSRFVGTLAADNNSVSGTWTRNGQPDAVVHFVRAANVAAVAPERPQAPQPPFPYRVEEVTFENAQAPGVTLAGTLTMPRGDGPFPAAVLISGSGPQDRDEAIFGHRPFAVLADHLTRHGIAVLRYDDRGFGQSTGNHDSATSADFATDANAAVRYLSRHSAINPDAIGLIGHSEGGMIAPLAAVESEQVAYLVLLAGPGTSTRQLIESQRRLLGLSMGMSPAELDRGEPFVAAINNAIVASTDLADAEARVRAILTPAALEALSIPPGQLDLRVQLYTRAWNRYFLTYDAQAVLAQVTVPVLALNGTLDLQVPADENLAAIATALKGNNDATVTALEGLNHMFQTAPTGALGEYQDIVETFAPVALEAISGWIQARFN